MGALDTAKEIGRIAVTSSLGKDVIDLLEKKVALLTEQIATLETENANLKKKIAELQQELDSLRPKQGELEEGAVKFLQLLFQHGDTTAEYAAQVLGIPRGVAEYHRDALFDAQMICWTSVGISTDWGESSGKVGLLPKGRAYIVKRGLAK